MKNIAWIIVFISSSVWAQDCPPFTSCFGCPVNWTSPVFVETDELIAPDLCKVTLNWNSDLDESQGINPLFVFICSYGDNSECGNSADEDACASCNEIIIDNVDPSKDPTISFSNSCGYLLDFPIATQCGTTGATVTHVSTSKPTSALITDQTTLTPPPSCPSYTGCSGCPTDWTHPTFSEFDELIGTDQCRVTINWDYSSIQHQGVNPLFVFICAYEDNSGCGNVLNEDFCASCNRFVIENVSPSKKPHLTFSDSCGYVSQFEIATNCGISGSSAFPRSTPEATTPLVTKETLVPGCPSYTQCFGCPVNWTEPILHETDEIIGSDDCRVTINWDSGLDFPTDIDPRMVFLCEYADRTSCGDVLNEDFCAGCNEFVIDSVAPSKNPVISYSDTCGNINSFPIAENCQGSTIYPPSSVTVPTGQVCPYYGECFGCSNDLSPIFDEYDELVDTNDCTVTLKWSFPYEDTSEINPLLVFICTYGDDSSVCGNVLNEDICASCQEFVLYGIDPTKSPYISYSDTCGNTNTFAIGRNC